MIQAASFRKRTKDDFQMGKNGESKEAKELEARIARESELEKMERRVNLQIQLMGKGRASKVRRKDDDSDDDENIPIYKWRPQRQK